MAIHVRKIYIYTLANSLLTDLKVRHRWYSTPIFNLDGKQPLNYQNNDNNLLIYVFTIARHFSKYVALTCLWI